MSLRTRQGLALFVTTFMVVAACGPGAPTPSPTGAATPTTAPTTGAPTGTGTTAPTPTATGAVPTPTGSEPVTTPSASPGANIDDLLFDSTYATEVQTGTPGGEVVISDWQLVSQLNPYYSNAFRNSQVIASAMRGLYTVSHDGKWHPDLGVNIPRLSDGSVVMDAAGGGFTVNIDIKPGLLWSDGEPLDLNDLAYTKDWIMDPAQVGLPGGTEGWDLIDAFDVAADGLTATVHFSAGYAGWLGLVSSAMLPEHYMSTIPVAEASTKSYPFGPGTELAPVSGPFKYASLGTASVELVRNDNWKGGVSSAHPAYLDRVIYNFYPGDTGKTDMIAAFKNGEVDVATDLLQGDYAAIAEGLDPAVSEALIAPAWEYEHFDFNQRGDGGIGSDPANPTLSRGHVALTDPTVRMALAQSIDKAALWETVYPGVPREAEEPCSPTPPGLYWRITEGLTCITHDTDAAKAALDAAGWLPGADTVREKDGVKLILQHCTTGAPFRHDAGVFLAAAFKEIGVTLNNTDAPETIFNEWNDPSATSECHLANGNYDTTEFAWVLTFDLFGDYYYSYHSSQIPTDANAGAGANYSRLNDPRMDPLLDTLKSTVDPAAQMEIAVDIQKLHTELQPEVVLYYRSSVRGVNANLENFFKNPGTTTDMWNVEDWFLSVP